jgi:hypothetical protein
VNLSYHIVLLALLLFIYAAFSVEYLKEITNLLYLGHKCMLCFDFWQMTKVDDSRTFHAENWPASQPHLTDASGLVTSLIMYFDKIDFKFDGF